MRLAIFAATGGVGRHLVDQALEAGHEVRAVVRRPQALHRELPVVTVDLSDPDPEMLVRAISGVDVVCSCLGPRGRSEIGVLSPGTRVIIDAMNKAGAQRIVAVSGASVSTVPRPGRPNPPGREPGDVAMMEDALRSSDLDWTAVRAPLLTKGPLPGNYRMAEGHKVPRGFRLSRADTAHFMLSTLDNPNTVKRALAVAY